MGNANDITIIVDAENRTTSAFGAAAKGAKTVGDVAEKAGKQLKAMEKSADDAAVKARKLAEAEERAADKTRQLVDKMLLLKKEIRDNGDASGELTRKLERLSAVTKISTRTTDDYRQAANRAAAEAREQARALDKVADNARQAARAVALLGAASALSPGGGAGGGRNQPSWLNRLLGLGESGAEGGLKGLGAGASAIGGLGPVAGPAAIGAAAFPALGAGVFAGAAAGGAITAGAGLAGAGAGLAGAWMGDPQKYEQQWNKAINGIQQRWMASSSAFGDELESGLKIVDQTLRNIPVEKILALSQSFVTPIATGSGQAITAIADGFADLLEKAQPVIDTLGPALGNLGHDVGDMFRMIGEGSEGGAEALGDFVDVVGYVVQATGLMVLGFERAYHGIREFESANFDFIKTVPVVGGFVEGFKESLFGIDSTSITVARSLGEAGQASYSAATGFGEAASAAAQAAVDTLAYNDALTSTRESMFGLADANLAVAQGWLDLAEGLKDGKKNLDSTSQSGLDNQKVISRQIELLERQRQQAIATGGDTVEATDAANAAYAEQMNALRAAAVAAGFNEGAVDRLIAAYGGIPPAKTTTVSAPGMATALSQGVALGNALGQIDGEYVAHIRLSGVGAALADAARVAAAIPHAYGGATGGGLSRVNDWGAPGLGAHAAGGVGGGWAGDMAGLGEIMRLPNGSTVIPAGSGRAMMRDLATGGGSGGGGGAPTLIFGSDGSQLGSVLVDVIALSMRQQGGDPALLGIKMQRG